MVNYVIDSVLDNHTLYKNGNVKPLSLVHFDMEHSSFVREVDNEALSSSSSANENDIL